MRGMKTLKSIATQVPVYRTNRLPAALLRCRYRPILYKNGSVLAVKSIKLELFLFEEGVA